MATSSNKALLFMAGGVLSLSCLDAVTKWLTAGYDTWQLIWLTRFVGLAASIFLSVRTTGAYFRFKTRIIGIHATRGAFGIATAWCFYEALRLMPLADAVTIGFAAPLFLTALSVPLLGETVTRGRWAIVALGFVGVVVALQPSQNMLASLIQNPGPILALGAALFYALILITLRRASSAEPNHVVLFWSQVFPILVAAPLALANWKTPDLQDGALFVLQGIFGTLGTLMMIKALRIGEASLLAPVEYTALIWSAILGALLFNQWPGPAMLAGAAIIVGAGILLARLERGKS